MKNNLILLLALILTIPMINSCKKGEEDPFISLRSRESRLKGEWNLTSGTVTINDGTSVTTKTFTESMVTITTDGQSNSYAHTETLEFLKDNIYKSTKMHDGNLELIDGFWAFMDGYGNDVADKEYVAIKIKSLTSGGSTHTYTGDEMPLNNIHLKKLTSSEIIIGYNGTSIEDSSTTTDLEKSYKKK